MTVALIVAAGRGERLGSERPKALVELAGRPLVQWSIDVLRQMQGIERIVVALPPGIAGSAEMASVAGEVTQDVAGGLVRAVPGGAVRSESVRLSLAAAGAGDSREMVLVHDAARPLLTGELVAATIGALERDASVDAAIAAIPIADTVRRVRDGVASETLDRSELWAVQTPQVFRRAALEQALDVSQDVLAQATDDAWLVERAGGRVAVVPASSENVKVTLPVDLVWAELLIARRNGDI